MSRNTKNTKATTKNTKNTTRKALKPDRASQDTRPRVVAKENIKREKELLAQLVKAREAKDRKAGKKIRRALRRLGHWGGLRLNTQPA